MFAQRADHFAGFAVGEPAGAGRIMDAAAVVKVDGSVRADLDAQATGFSETGMPFNVR